jgi:hypothetical protein
MKRRRLWLGYVAAVLILGGFAAGVLRSPRFQKWYEPPVLMLPADDEVAEMRASLRASEFGFRETTEFAVPPEDVPHVLHWVRPAEYVRQPPVFPGQNELGQLRISTRAGRELVLRFYWAGKNPAALSADSVDYFWGPSRQDESGHWLDGGMGLANAVRVASERSAAAARSSGEKARLSDKIKKAVEQNVKPSVVEEFVGKKPLINTINKDDKRALRYSWIVNDADGELYNRIQKASNVVYWLRGIEGRNMSIVGIYWDEASKPTMFEASLMAPL